MKSAIYKSLVLMTPRGRANKKRCLGILALSVLLVSAPGSACATSKHLVLYVARVSSEYVDIPPSGPSVGDIRVNVHDVRRSLHGEVIGTRIVRLMTVKIDSAGGDEIRDASVQYTLPGGTISLSGINKFPSGAGYPERVPQAIIGGTGKFEGVAGTSIFHPIDNVNALVRFKFVNK